MKMFKELFEMFPEEKLEKNPIHNIWNTLGDAYNHLKNDAKRDYCYKKELKLLDKTHRNLDFENVATCTAYAKLHTKLNNISVAEEFADLAVKLDPFSENAWYVMRFVAKKKEDYVNALNYLINAYKINCESTAVMVELSEVYEKLGDIARAYHYIERAYLWDPLWFIPREKASAMRTPELFRNSRNFDQRSSLIF